MKQFKTGVIVGRFEHIHIGHEKLINIGLSVCDTLLILVSCANESGTLQNPYDYDYRVKLIKKIYNEEISERKIVIAPLDDTDLKKKLSHDLGRHILNESIKILGSIPECIIYGKDKDISKCFDAEDIKNISEIIVDREKLNVSATKIREYILNDDISKWKECVNEKIYNEYCNLKKFLVETCCKN